MSLTGRMEYWIDQWRKRREKPCLDFLNSREQFIPIRLDLICQKLYEDVNLTPEERECMRTLRCMLQEHCHYDYHQRFLSLKLAFVPFNPDIEAVYEKHFSEEEKNQCREKILSGITEFLKVSNYQELTGEELQECLKLQPIGGLTVKIDFEKFTSFQVYYRGVSTKMVTEPRWYFWKQNREVSILKRVFLLAGYKGKSQEERIIVKMFRDLRLENLKIIAPEVKLLLPFFDKIKVGGTALVGAAPTLLKLANFSLILLTNFYFVVVMLFGFGAAAVKGIFGFFNSRTRCMSIFSSNLYYNTLANNVAAVSVLVDQAETQEIKESLLAYMILYQEGKKGRNLNLEQLDEAAEQWLLEKFHHPIDFDVDDALRKLIDKKIVHKEGNVYRVCSLRTTCRRLDEIWDNLHIENNFGDATADVVL